MRAGGACERSVVDFPMTWQKRRTKCARSAAALVALTLTTHNTPALADNIRLTLPVACTLGKTCFLQNYVDRVPGKGVGDYTCGQATYDGHKGTDFRVLSVTAARKNVSVLAAAPGRVLRVRDGVADKLITGKNDASVKGKECGNGVVIDHGEGWQTQYCHLMQGSVAVAKGDTIARGARMGAVGFSGHAQFAHLHITVRHQGRVVDPFLVAPAGRACANGQPPRGSGLWEAELAPLLAYSQGQLIEYGFAGGPVGSALLEREGAPELTKTSNAFVTYVRFINLKKGDVIRLGLVGPGGFKAHNKMKPLTRPKAQYVAYVGKRRRAKAWPAGRYTSTVELVRGGKVVISKASAFEIVP